MKILHSSDWHLGRTLFGRRRHDEFTAFLDWLTHVLHARRPDALLVSGDIFDTGTPGVRAQELYYRFLRRAADSPCRHVVITAGNHDLFSTRPAPCSMPCAFMWSARLCLLLPRKILTGLLCGIFQTIKECLTKSLPCAIPQAGPSLLSAPFPFCAMRICASPPPEKVRRIVRRACAKACWPTTPPSRRKPASAVPPLNRKKARACLL